MTEHESNEQTPDPTRGGVTGRVKGSKAVNEPTVWVANWCRPNGPEWGHSHCKGFIRNGSMAAREIMLCECPACHGNATHNHTQEELAASKLPNPLAVLSSKNRAKSQAVAAATDD